MFLLLLLLLLGAILRRSNIYKIFCSEEVNTRCSVSERGGGGVVMLLCRMSP